MVSYLNSIKSRESMLCTPEIFEQLTTSPMVAQLIEDYRKGNAAAKQLLPSFMFQGYDPNILLGKTGSRVAKNLKPTGVFIMDFDHIGSLTPLTPSPKGEGENTPAKLYDRFLQKLPTMGLELQRDVALAHITPSGDGLRLVIKLPKGKSIEEAQKDVAEAMGVEMDGVVKDLSRQSFCPMASDVLYINKEVLFKTPPQPSPTGEGAIELPSSIQTSVESREISSIQTSVESYNSTPSPVGEGWGGAFPTTFQGIPYTNVVENLKILHGGEPQVGNRNNYIFNMASDLAKITDRSQPWIESLLPNPGLPIEEYKTTIAGVCRKAQETGISHKLKQALAMSKKVQEQEDATITADNIGDEPPMPEVLPAMVETIISKVMPRQRAALANTIFPALATYVSNAQFYAHDNKPFELSLMAVVCGESAAGKGEVTTVNNAILDRINKRDIVYRQKLKDHNTKQKNKKANERGSELTECPIQHIFSDCTRAAFLQRLSLAQEGAGERSNLPTFTSVDEVQSLYKFCADGGKLGVQEMICMAWDRSPIGAERATSAGVNADTLIRWNWVASTTLQGCRKFFDSCITGGEVSRIMFCPMIVPDGIERNYKLGIYDKEYRDALVPYIDNLEAFHCERDEDGYLIPVRFPEIDALTDEILNHMYDISETMPDRAYYNYGKRNVLIAQKVALLCYIANGCKWEDAIAPFTKWVFDWNMWSKMQLFGEKAAERFESENLKSGYSRSPLAKMGDKFTQEEFGETCLKLGLKTNPRQLLYTYRNRGLVSQGESGVWHMTEKCRAIHRK